MEFSAQEIREAFRSGVSLVFYPALTVGILIFVSITVINQINQAADRVRRLTAAMLPVIVLIFALISTEVSGEEITAAVGMNGGMQFFLGGLLGASAVFVGRWLRYSSREIGPTVYVLMLSSLFCSLLYAIAYGGFTGLRTYLFGMIVGGAVYVITAGWFWPKPSRKTTEAKATLMPDYDSSRQTIDDEPKIYPPSI